MAAGVLCSLEYPGRPGFAKDCANPGYRNTAVTYFQRRQECLLHEDYELRAMLMKSESSAKAV